MTYLSDVVFRSLKFAALLVLLILWTGSGKLKVIPDDMGSRRRQTH